MTKRGKSDGPRGPPFKVGETAALQPKPSRRSERAGRGMHQQHQTAAADDEEEEPERNIFGKGPGTKRVGKVLLGWANLLLDVLLGGKPCPTSRAQIVELAARLEVECDSKIRRHSHLFDRTKCVEVIEDRAQGKSRSGKPIGPGPEPRVKNRPTESGSRRDVTVTLNAAAVARREVREAAALELENAIAAKEDDFLATGRHALAAMEVIVTNAGQQQIAPRCYEAAREAYTAALTAQSPLVALTLKGPEGRDLAGRLQDTIVLLKEKAIAVADWLAPAAPPGHVFIPSQEPGYGEAVAGAPVAPAVQKRARKNIDLIKKKFKALKTANKALLKKVKMVGDLGTLILDNNREQMSKPRFARISERDRVSEDAANNAVGVLRSFMLQRREVSGRAGLEHLSMPTLYVISTMSDCLPTIKTCTNADPFLRNLIGTLVSARHESPAQADQEADARKVRKTKKPRLDVARMGAKSCDGNEEDDDDDSDNDDDDDDDDDDETR